MSKRYHFTSALCFFTLVTTFLAKKEQGGVFTFKANFIADLYSKGKNNGRFINVLLQPKYEKQMTLLVCPTLKI